MNKNKMNKNKWILIDGYKEQFDGERWQKLDDEGAWDENDK